MVLDLTVDLLSVLVPDDCGFRYGVGVTSKHDVTAYSSVVIMRTIRHLLERWNSYTPTNADQTFSFSELT